MTTKTSQKTKASSRPATSSKVKTKLPVRKSAAEKSGGGGESNNWDNALKEVFDKCIKTLNEDVQSLNPKDRLVFLKAIRDHFSPEDKAKKQPPGSDVNEVKITILHKCIDDVRV